METFVPFSTLPACAGQCGPLFDANGACAPAGVTSAPAAIASCFCSNPKVAPFSAGTAGVCDNACAASPTDFGSIRNWFTSFCANPATVTGIGSGQNGASTSTAVPGQSNNGDWLSSHWQWVVMIVILVVGISCIWIGACVWRRRYIRKRDRQYALGKRLGEAGVGANAGQQGTTNSANGNMSSRSVHVPSAGMFDAAPISSAAHYGPETEKEKQARMKKKWNPTART
ncbi:hypothetical protein MCOR27_000883 [Pyricularia oryzae]|uniref:Integral membrane protein n=5 Tax=Pyricularia TaxID=48558 RepID=A0ABQ8NU43_PYRGI|nr:uncharacterized protein MGG_00062 [Pyricularia oryzae 70-15]ELQ42269.1 hypothetical protein OOU_Y34scaffold00217g11 [Pyricularia oryzae Y34]KAH8841426.1 hypothetical protein MCOR01_008091 [Pyricularia oryzae]KAI6302151.1 hypothetical protein MCOR33_002468 [Pyricularia grisea]EHA49495.1 hypothetical protein MGG_00062 [Pyricularia oryzae 70-15]KAH9433229.1 hypothetical protein MCOR02_005285 [Pyricularia oryzae]